MATKVQSFAFVPVSRSGKTRARDRKLVRSHCMQGRNQRIGLKPLPPTSEVSQRRHDSADDSHPSPESFSLSPDQFRGGTGPTKVRNTLKWTEPICSVPPPCPPDLALVRFACDVDRDSQELIFNSVTQGKESMYPLGLAVDFDLSRSLWFQWLFWDPAYLYCVLYGASAARDYIRRRPSRLTHSHLNSTVTYLNRHLSDRSLATRDSTVAVIITLAMIAGMIGDQCTIMAHVAGLRSIVRERGGLDAFRHDPKLHIKIGRIELAYSLATGETTPFFNDPVSLAPIFKLPGLPSTSSCGLHDLEMYGLKDHRIAAIFRDLQHYTDLINRASTAEDRRPAAEFQNVLCSVQYRLVQLRGSLGDIPAECLRLAMLAFLTTTFRVPGQSSRYPHLAGRFRECCLALEVATPQLRDLTLWFLIVGAMALYDGGEEEEEEEQEWLRRRWSGCVPDDMTWSRARVRLKNIMWIDAIHDWSGERAFMALSQTVAR
ncbi:hypothetical protein BKA67DRAFT_663094 [Truncatella angustata]|uniref:Uncharacterized protein n=1 Tax=Truncatella angustata TaxID=152316 RepID=A0A9P8RLY6_9PEZI|nr:uncharacterized protein BKA67DRAFT_663094 [Truncatella angustata]KAH6646693.1 hypothetical protein BKA67DRAFT_663094 [Truncatella angustata]